MFETIHALYQNGNALAYSRDVERLKAYAGRRNARSSTLPILWRQAVMLWFGTVGGERMFEIFPVLCLEDYDDPETPV